MSIKKLADLLHMQKTVYHNRETGKRELPFELAITLAKFYDVSLDYIGGLTNDTTTKTIIEKCGKGFTLSSVAFLFTI